MSVWSYLCISLAVAIGFGFLKVVIWCAKRFGSEFFGTSGRHLADAANHPGALVRASDTAEVEERARANAEKEIHLFREQHLQRFETYQALLGGLNDLSEAANRFLRAQLSREILPGADQWDHINSAVDKLPRLRARVVLTLSEEVSRTFDSFLSELRGVEAEDSIGYAAQVGDLASAAFLRISELARADSPIAGG